MNHVPLGYRYLWAIVAGISIVTGALLALVTLLVGAWITVLIFGALTGCAALHLLRENRSRTGAAWDYGTAAVGGAGVALAMAGLVSAFDGSGAALVAVLMVSSPPAVRWYGSRVGLLQAGRRPPGRDADGDQASLSPGVGHDVAAHFRANVSAMPDRVLINAWRLSEISLAKARSTQEISQQVLSRSMILDEIQLRYPAGFESWIADGAPADSDPSGYAQPTPETRPETRGDDID